MKKIGIIRCQQTEDICPGTTDFLTVAQGKGSFASLGEECEIMGFVSCGGCPGKRAVARAQMLVSRRGHCPCFLYGQGCAHRLPLSAFRTDLQGHPRKDWRCAPA